MSKAKAAALSTALLLVSTVLCLVLAEIGWRLVKGVKLGARDNLVQQALDLVRTHTGSMVHDPLIGWRLRDDLRLAYLTTGAEGVRMNQKAAAPLRSGGILAVGDSFTVGSGVNDDETWPARLEALTGRPVANAAAGAYGVDQIVLRAEQLLPVLRADTLVVGLLSQDSLRNNFSVFGGGYKPYFTIEGGKAVLQGVPVPKVEAAPLALGPVRAVLGHSHLMDSAVKALGLQQWWIDNRLRYKKIHDDKVGVAISCLLMARLADRSKSEGLRVIVVMMYGAGEIEGTPAPWFASDVVACARQHGLEVTDTYGPIRAVLQRDRAAFVDLWLDEGGQLGHPSAKGQQFVADLLYRNHFAR
ncbi:MAG: hypothetical protein JNM30_13445 [Rhodospirillales bacterium]|nr:hypothetical protein [Rhodospirillales bacterium]